MQSAALSPLQMVKNLLPSSDAPKSSADNPELVEMRQRIAELEMQLQKSKARKKRSPRKS